MTSDAVLDKFSKVSVKKKVFKIERQKAVTIHLN